MAIGRDQQHFANGIRPTVLTNRDGEALARAATPGGDGHLIRSLVQMDAPDHMKYRLLTQSWFMPKNLKIVEDRIRHHARSAVEQMLSTDGTCDFARDDSIRSEEHTSELQSLMRISYAVFCLKKKIIQINTDKRILNISETIY